MSCYNPLYAYRDPSDTSRPVKILGANPVKDSFNMAYIPQLKDYREVFPVPCGKCIGCRLDYSKTWADRCVMESLSYDKDECWFLTLTYDDEHLPPLLDSACVEGNPYYSTTRKSDYVDFMKRFRISEDRKRDIKGIREFGCSEYGGDSLRPHFHQLIFGDDLTPYLDYYKANVLGDPLFKSDYLTKIWGHGYVVVGKFNWRTAAYTARYILKKVKGEHADELYSNLGIERESRFGSNRPGIGRPFFEAHYKEIYERDQIILPAIDGKPHVIKPPKYFDDLYEKIDALHLESLKEERKRVADTAHQEELYHTDLDEDEYFKVKENFGNSFKNIRNCI